MADDLIAVAREQSGLARFVLFTHTGLKPYGPHRVTVLDPSVVNDALSKSISALTALGSKEDAPQRMLEVASGVASNIAAIKDYDTQQFEVMALADLYARTDDEFRVWASQR